MNLLTLTQKPFGLASNDTSKPMILICLTIDMFKCQIYYFLINSVQKQVVKNDEKINILKLTCKIKIIAKFDKNNIFC